MRGGIEECQGEAAELREGPQRVSTSCLRLGGVYYREDGEFHIEAYRRHPFLEQLEEQGLLVGHYAVPQGRPGRYRPLSEVAAGDVSRSVTPDTSRKRAGGYSDGSQEDQSENSSEDNDDAEVEVPADPAAASTSKGVLRTVRGAEESKGKGRRKKERIANRTRSNLPGNFLSTVASSAFATLAWDISVDTLISMFERNKEAEYSPPELCCQYQRCTFSTHLRSILEMESLC